MKKRETGWIRTCMGLRRLLRERQMRRKFGNVPRALLRDVCPYLFPSLLPKASLTSSIAQLINDNDDDNDGDEVVTFFEFRHFPLGDFYEL